MKVLSLNISKLNLEIDLSESDPELSSSLADIFSSFISPNRNSPHETVNVFRLQKDHATDISPGLEYLIKQNLELPLKKYPFTDHPKRRSQFFLKSLKTFFKDSRYVSYFDGLKRPEDVVVYPLNRASLVRRLHPVRTGIFLSSGSVHDNVESIREAIHFTLSMLLPLFGSLLLHGVGIRRDGIGHLFLGDSGAGKSTVAHNSNPEDIVSDDGIIVEQDSREIRLNTSPINQSRYSESDLIEFDFSDIRLVRGFFVIKDKRDYLEGISPPEACSIILKNHIHYFRHFPQDSLKRSLSIVSNLCRQVHFDRLHFRKDGSFWSLIEG